MRRGRSETPLKALRSWRGGIYSFGSFKSRAFPLHNTVTQWNFEWQARGQGPEFVSTNFCRVRKEVESWEGHRNKCWLSENCRCQAGLARMSSQSQAEGGEDVGAGLWASRRESEAGRGAWEVVLRQFSGWEVCRIWRSSLENLKHWSWPSATVSICKWAYSPVTAD